MPASKLPPEPWLSFLRELDNHAASEAQLHCMGGFVVSLLYGFSRPTADLDVLSVVPREARALLEIGARGSELHKKYRVYIDAVGIAHLPEDYEQRLVPMYPEAFRYLRLQALDPYDLALSKLERNIQRDRDDVKHLARTVPLDLEILKQRYEKELRWQMGNPEREDLTVKLWLEMIAEARQ
ncbi:MAG TPA: DUF6036 family nucleotidyltransferase [Terriglobales bacterium]|nr:DUF6036 family nucleotidyltransferase [Terriglobales bacterium]